jgi:arylmalonate decarboxylase
MIEKPDIRVGVLVPSGNTVHQAEFARLRPKGVEFRFVGFTYPPRDSPSFNDDLIVSLGGPIAELKDWGARVILWGCTTASMACSSKDYMARFEQMAGVPFISAATASREAMKALGINSVSVATPYSELNNGIVAKFLTDLGIEVAAIEGLGFDKSAEIWLANQPSLTPDFVFKYGLSLDNDAADALYLPCTGMGSIQAIDMFEHKTGKPAFSSVQAGYWASLRRIGFDGRQSGHGQLLEVWDY